MAVFAVGEKVQCCNDRYTEQCLTHGWEYKVEDIHETGGIKVKDGLSVPIYWSPARFQRSFKREELDK